MASLTDATSLAADGEVFGEVLPVTIGQSDEVKWAVRERIFVEANCFKIDSRYNTKIGLYFIPSGWYYVLDADALANLYKLQAVAQRRGDFITEIGSSDGTITAAHLRSAALFEAILDRAAQERPAPAVTRFPPGGPIENLRSHLWTLIFPFLVPRNDLGVFSFDFDAGLAASLLSSTAMYNSIARHPMWITDIIGLPPRLVGSVLAYPSLTCSGVAKHICLNAARLPDLIRKDPEFREILRPETRHQILQKQAAHDALLGPELPVKMKAMQLLGSFLLGEPAFRGDADKDPVTAELLALATKISKEDPLFVLKLAHYTRHTLTFRSTTNFLLATATRIESCKPYVRTAIPACTNLPTDLLELWDFHRKLTNSPKLPSCLKKGMSDKFDSFGVYQLGKYLNVRVPKTSAVAPPKSKGKGKGKGKGKASSGQPDEKAQEEAQKQKLAREEALKDPMNRPLTMKTLIRHVHAGSGKNEDVCGILRKQYPMNEEEFKLMGLDQKGKTFDESRVGSKFRIDVPKTWETELSEKGNTPQVWEDLVNTGNLPFMAMLKNLRNLILAGVSTETHEKVMGRLKSPKQIANSKQMPVKFLSAFEAIDFDEQTLRTLAEEFASGLEFIETEKAYGSGKDAKKVLKKRRVCTNPPTVELLNKYRNALETAVSLAARNNVPALECPTGKAVLLVDVSGSMEGRLTQGPRKLHQSALKPHRRSTIIGGRPIVEGMDMDLEDYFSQSGQRLSRKLSVSMTWIGRDLDLSCSVMNKDGENVMNVSFQKLDSAGVWHSGDITDAPYGAEEIITVDLDKLPENAFMLSFVVNSYSGEKFDDMEEAALSLRDDGLEGNSVDGTQEICSFRLTGTHKVVVACCLVKKESGWAFRCLNTPQAAGSTVQSALGTIKKEFDALMADAATNGKRLVDAALLLALCVRERLGGEKCEIVLFSSSKDGGPRHKVLRNLGPKVLANVRRCLAAAKELGRGTELPIAYLQELAVGRVPLDHLILLTDGLVSPAQNPGDALTRWLRAYRDQVQPVRFACIDVLGLGKPCLGQGGNDQNVLISGYSEATLRYLTQKPDAQLEEVEAVVLPPPKTKSSDKTAA